MRAVASSIYRPISDNAEFTRGCRHRDSSRDILPHYLSPAAPPPSPDTFLRRIDYTSYYASYYAIVSLAAYALSRITYPCNITTIIIETIEILFRVTNQSGIPTVELAARSIDGLKRSPLQESLRLLSLPTHARAHRPSSRSAKVLPRRDGYTLIPVLRTRKNSARYE